MANEQEEVIVDDLEDTNEEVAEDTEETQPKAEKPKRTPQEELEYFEGRASRLRKKLGLDKSQEVEKPESKPVQKSSDLDYGQKAFLKTYGISGSDELALAKTFMSRTGDDLDTIVSDEIFLGKLNNLRLARESANAVPKSTKRSNQPAGDDFSVALAKYKDTGELPTDISLRRQVLNKHIEQERGSNFAPNSVVMGGSVITQ